MMPGRRYSEGQHQALPRGDPVVESTHEEEEDQPERDPCRNRRGDNGSLRLDVGIRLDQQDVSARGLDPEPDIARRRTGGKSDEKTEADEVVIQRGVAVAGRFDARIERIVDLDSVDVGRPHHQNDALVRPQVLAIARGVDRQPDPVNRLAIATTEDGIERCRLLPLHLVERHLAGRILDVGTCRDQVSPGRHREQKEQKERKMCAAQARHAGKNRDNCGRDPEIFA